MKGRVKMKKSKLLTLLLLILIMVFSFPITHANEITPTSYVETLPSHYYVVEFYNGGFYITLMYYINLLIPTGYTYIQHPIKLEYKLEHTTWNNTPVKSLTKWSYEYELIKR